ncbi:carbohydrate kinase family protein [Nocardia sp. NPDC088792]|uniref:carbohydrate kinase family protein n=1 Tax=Nocardia sp. NPDC088792 TaxID=3364332 RepID=UPI00382019A7
MGAYFADLIFHGLPEAPRPGHEIFADGFAMVPGGAYTLAMATHRLGHDVVWATDFGTDPFSACVLRAVHAERLDDTAFRHHARPLRSLTVALSTARDRAMISYQDPVSPEPISSLLLRYRPRLLMVPQLRYDTETLQSLRLARHLGTAVFMDCQDIPADLGTPGVREALTLTDVFTPNAAEALRLTGAPTLDEALTRLGELAPTVVIKRGPEGATALHAGHRYDLAAQPVPALDTTGAGDCFDAGLVHGRLAGWSLPDCLAAAVACGSAVVGGPGSVAAPDAAELTRRLGGLS